MSDITSESPRRPVLLAATQDVDEQAALLEGWHQNYAQMSAGPFKGRIEEAWLDGVHLFVEATSRRLLQRGALSPDRFAIGVPLQRGEGQAVFCGSSDWSGRYCVFSGEAGFEFFTPEGLEMAGLEFSLDELSSRLCDVERESLRRVVCQAGLYLGRSEALEGLREFMHGTFDLIRSAPSLLDNPAVARTLRQAALSNVMELLMARTDMDVDLAATPLTGQRAWHWVAQARSFAVADPQSPVTVAQLCEALGVSRRTLQLSFQNALNMSPAQFLRAVRLAGARRALRCAESVTEAAAQWGFWHFSHFAQDYRRMFGELPSDTWRRLHPRGANRSRLH